MLQEEQEVGLRNLVWDLEGAPGPSGSLLCPCKIEMHPPLSTTFLLTAKVSRSSACGVTPELIKCESLIVLAISHHILLICIILVSIFTNVT